MRIPRCKGAKDKMPQDMILFRKIEEAFRTSCTKWGYEEVKTPVLEYLHLFTAAGTLTPDMLSRVYTFLDWDGWSGERVVLRPDGTIPVARLYVESLTDKSIARLFYTENMFSFEDTGQESRERWQCGAELIGGTEPEGDAELIMLALEVLAKLFTTPVKVKLSHVGLFKNLLSELGLEDYEKDKRLRQVLAGDVNVLKKLGTQPADIKDFMKLLFDLRGSSLGFLENLKSVLPKRLSSLGRSIDDLAEVAELLDSIGQEYEIDFATGEGFEYYTGMVFQFLSSGKVIGNGGRYDELIPLVGGPDVPASGFALFVDKIASIQNLNGLKATKRILLKGKTGQVKGMKYSFDLARTLRERGFIVEMDMGSGSSSDFDWVANLQKKGRKFIIDLTDVTAGSNYANLSKEQLLKALGRAK